MLRTLATLALALPLAGCSEPHAASRVIEGEAFGTTFTVRIAPAPALPAHDALVGEVRAVFARVDEQMSTYRDDSELVRFNRTRSLSWRPVSADTARVGAAALEIARRSGGAFDPSVAPLVRLWGFGAGANRQQPPSPESLRAARAVVGYAKLDVRERPPALRKHAPQLELDLSAIAKGWAVDAVAERLSALGARGYLVEVGGELRARGERPGGGAWRVAIEDPLATPARVLTRVVLRDEAIATSGPYRNFSPLGGGRVSHLIDPRTGAPAASELISVSVIASSAMWADGWATALFVAGLDDGLALAERERLAALFVTTRAERRATASFARHWTE